MHHCRSCSTAQTECFYVWCFVSSPRSVIKNTSHGPVKKPTTIIATISPWFVVIATRTRQTTINRTQLNHNHKRDKTNKHRQLNKTNKQAQFHQSVIHKKYIDNVAVTWYRYWCIVLLPLLSIVVSSISKNTVARESEPIAVHIIVDDLYISVATSHHLVHILAVPIHAEHGCACHTRSDDKSIAHVAV